MLIFFGNKQEPVINLIFCSKVLFKLVPNNDDNSVFMVHFKLACVRDNLLMRHKNCRQLGNRHTRYSHGSCDIGHTGHGSVE